MSVGCLRGDASAEALLIFVARGVLFTFTMASSAGVLLQLTISMT